MSPGSRAYMLKALLFLTIYVYALLQCQTPYGTSSTFTLRAARAGFPQRL